jgi:hypothetical protein
MTEHVEIVALLDGPPEKVDSDVETKVLDLNGGG